MMCTLLFLAALKVCIDVKTYAGESNKRIDQ